MEEKELLLKEIKGLIADSTKENVNKKDLEARIEAINKTIAEKFDNNGMKELKESVDQIVAASAENAAAIKAMAEMSKKENKEKPMTFKDALIDAVVEHGKKVKGLVVDVNDSYGERKSIMDYMTSSGNRSTGEIKINKVVDMLESSIVQNNVATVRLTELDPQRVGLPLTLYPHVTDWMPSKTIQRPTMSILVVYDYSDGAGTKTEGSAPTQSSFLLKTVEFKSFSIATYFTLSDETLDDLNEAMEEIASIGPSRILDNIDGQVLGTAGDDSSALAGLGTANKRTAFASATTYAASIPSATEFDVFATMKLQAETAKYMPDVLVLNPVDINKLAARKDQLDNSIMDRRLVFNAIGEPVMLSGLRIIKSSSVTADTCFVLDSKQLMLGKRKEMSMEIGYNGTDLTEGQKTVVIKTRLAFGVRDKAAVIYCSGVAAAIADITI